MARTLVIGLYDDNGQTFAANADAADPHAAMAQVAQDIMQEPEGANLIILGAIDSRLLFIAPSGNGGSGVYASDLAGGEDDNTA